MSSPVNAKFPELKFTNNNLQDIIGFIKDKNVVALHTERACRVFHAISFEQPESLESLKDIRVIYIDCNSHESLLAEGEWEWFIKDAIKTVHELGLDSVLRKAIIDQRSIPNKEYTVLGY